MEQNPILTNQLSLNSDIPLYSQLVGIIKRSISSGTLNVGDLLPSEAELCRALDVSRNTVRQAIGELEEEGLVVRKRGKGTFVADPNTNRRGVRYSFTTEISSLGKVPSSTLVDFAVITPSREVCEKMELHEGTSVYCFTRVRNVDGEPLILETSYYPKYIYPNLTRELVQTHSFYSLLYHVGITPFAADESYEAIILDADRARLLGVAARALEKGGADFFVICTNTMHKVAPQVQAAVSIPLLHIGDVTAAEILGRGLRTVGLLGTRYTMEENFYCGRLRQ